VDVDGETLYARAEDVDDLASAGRSGVVRLVPAFDGFVLGPGTSDERILDPAQRKEVSKAAGWIAPLVLADGRLAGTWTAVDGVPVPSLFSGVQVSSRKLASEVKRVGALLAEE
jgi:hypothetical protein